MVNRVVVVTPSIPSVVVRTILNDIVLVFLLLIDITTSSALDWRPAYFGTLRMRDVDALRKYGLRRFDYIPRTNDADLALYPTHSLTDRFSMFVDTIEVRSIRTSYREMLGKFDIMDVEWFLGGTLDVTGYMR